MKSKLLLRDFFKKKVTIAKWQLNLFGLVCFLTGSVFGIYLVVSKQFPAIFAADAPTTITKTAESDFASGSFTSTQIAGAPKMLQLNRGANWSQLANAPFSQAQIGAMVSDNNGTVYVLNGDSNSSSTPFYKFNAASGWTALTSPPAPTDFTAAAYDGNGHIYVLRNRTMYPWPTWTDNFWKYTIATDTWEILASTPSRVAGGFLVFANDGNLYANSGGYGSQMMKYEIASNTWTLLNAMPDASNTNYGASDGNGNIFVLRGNDTIGTWTSTFWKYNIATSTWHVLNDLPGPSSYGSSLVYDGSGSMYSIGDGNSFWKYDIASGLWSAESTANTALYGIGYEGSTHIFYALANNSFFKYDVENATAGSFVSSPVDLVWNGGWTGANSFTANVDIPTGTNLTFYIKTADSTDDLANAPYIKLENGVLSGGVFSADLATNTTPVANKRYVQIKIDLSSSVTDTPKVSNFALNYLADNTPPETDPSNLAMQEMQWDNNGNQSYKTVNTGEWANQTQQLVFSWNDAADSGSGMLGYCVYLGQDPSGDPASSGGLLKDTDPTLWSWGMPAELLDVKTAGNKCHFVVNEKPTKTTLDLVNNVINYGGLIDGKWEIPSSTKSYYLNIKAIDRNGNLSASPMQFQFKVDNQTPQRSKYISAPGDFVSSKAVTVTWPTSGSDAANDMYCYEYGGDNPDANGCAFDKFDTDGKTPLYKYEELSGIAGYQYKIGNDWNDGIWYGLKHTGTQGMDDLIPVDAGSYTMQEQFKDANGNPITDGNGNVLSDFANLKEGTNHVWLRPCDRAGNCSQSSEMRTSIKINTFAPSSPRELSVTPKDSTTNSYEFNWKVPETFTGDTATKLSYCYTVNAVPSKNSCIFTDSGVTKLPADAFASQPGENIFYVVARDEAGNINYDTYNSIKFSYSGSAPSIPRSVDAADISIKATSNWKLAVSWEQPDYIGAGIDSYKIFRSETKANCSTNFGAFKEIGSTSGTSYADPKLAQKDYYYCVKACDSANNCSAASATISKFPNGKFTEPAELTSGPDVNNVTTSKATITWATDRGSDSRVAFGKKSGEYFKEEPSESDQVTGHSINLNSLSPGTTYYFVTKWVDEDGNMGVSKENSFHTDPAPVVKDVQAKDVGLTNAFLKFTTKGASKVKVYYGTSASFGSAKEMSTSGSESTYSLTLQNLNDDTKYYYKINTFDSDGQEYEGTTLDFTTLPRPRISDIQVEQIKDSAQPGMHIVWSSNTEISSIVSYNPVNDPTDKRNDVQVDLVSGKHEAIIMNLKPMLTYSLVVSGIDRAGNEAVSDAYTFTTASDTRPPEISNVMVEGTNIGSGADKRSQLAVSWDTDEPASSQVEFGEGVSANYAQKTQEDANLTMNHMVVISGLEPSKVYHLRIVSHDLADNVARSIDTVSITPKAIDSAYELVVGNLTDIFKFLRGAQN